MDMWRPGLHIGVQCDRNICAQPERQRVKDVLVAEWDAPKFLGGKQAEGYRLLVVRLHLQYLRCGSSDVIWWSQSSLHEKNLGWLAIRHNEQLDCLDLSNLYFPDTGYDFCDEHCYLSCGSGRLISTPSVAFRIFTHANVTIPTTDLHI